MIVSECVTLVLIFTALLLVHSHSVHYFDVYDAISKFVAILQCMRNITPGGSEAREIRTNTTHAKLRTLMRDFVFTKKNKIK